MKLPFYKRTNEKALVSEADQIRVMNAIAKAEITTSGEIRIYMERHCPAATPLDRAAEIFYSLEMDETIHKNGVLIYIALEDKLTAIYGDKGIYDKTKDDHFWENELTKFINHLRKQELIEGLEELISDIGYALGAYYPYEPGVDKNELPDAIVFGS